MDILIITDTGCEEACALELKRWTKKAPAVHENVLEISLDLEEAAKIACYLQTARRVLVKIATAEDLEHLPSIDELSLEKVLPKKLTFKAEGDVLTHAREQGMMGQELVEAVGGWMHHTGRKVNLSSPDMIVYAVATEKIWIGVDLIGRPLAKREWRIHLSKRSLKATIAAAVVLYAGVKEGEEILDPLADDGTISIEAALLFSRTSPLRFSRNFAFEKLGIKVDLRAEEKEISKIGAYVANLKELKAIRTNAKLAGVEKYLHATKVEMSWLELKAGEGNVNRMITAPIPSGKSISIQQAAKMADELFYQAEFVLKKKGTITCITEKPDELLEPAKKYGFSIVVMHEVLMGLRKMTIITFGK